MIDVKHAAKLTRLYILAETKDAWASGPVPQAEALRALDSIGSVTHEKAVWIIGQIQALCCVYGHATHEDMISVMEAEADGNPVAVDDTQGEHELWREEHLEQRWQSVFDQLTLIARRVGSLEGQLSTFQKMQSENETRLGTLEEWTHQPQHFHQLDIKSPADEGVIAADDPREISVG